MTHQVPQFSLTKDHGITSKPLQKIYTHHYKGAYLEVWHAEVDQLDVHFGRKSEKCERMEPCDKFWEIWLHFSPCLADDLVHLIKYFWAA